MYVCIVHVCELMTGNVAPCVAYVEVRGQPLVIDSFVYFL